MPTAAENFAAIPGPAELLARANPPARVPPTPQPFVSVNTDRVPGYVPPVLEPPPPAAPTTPAGAAERIDQLKADPDFISKYLAGDREAREQFTALHQQAAGGSADDPVSGITAQMRAREDAHQAQGGFAQQRIYGFSDDELFEIQNQRPISPKESRHHELEYDRMLRDQDFQMRLQRQERAALREWALASQGRRLPVAKNPAQVEAWLAMHYAEYKAHDGTIRTGIGTRRLGAARDDGWN